PVRSYAYRRGDEARGAADPWRVRCGAEGDAAEISHGKGSCISTRGGSTALFHSRVRNVQQRHTFRQGRAGANGRDTAEDEDADRKHTGLSQHAKITGALCLSYAGPGYGDGGGAQAEKDRCGHDGNPAITAAITIVINGCPEDVNGAGCGWRCNAGVRCRERRW